MDWDVPFFYFRLLLAAIVVGVLALLFLIFSSGSLMIEKQERRILERRLDDLTQRVARVHSLETQLEETTLVLLKIQDMLEFRPQLSDSLFGGSVAMGNSGGDATSQTEGRISLAGKQVLSASPNSWPVRGWVTRDFSGLRGPDYHAGIDIAAEENTSIRAAGDGVVLVAGWNEEYGNFLLLDHGFGVTSLYAHNSSLAVRKEDRVRTGDVIGFMGNSGRSTGPHLHFEVRKNGIPVNPKNYLLD
jgi:murein DD-endopeptidase MepM/ murein hydrolase activator NlpD